MADSFSLLVNDSSPTLSYYPFADTLSVPNFFEGWNPCFTVSACPTIPGQQGNGSTFHVTSRDGAAFSIQWSGTPSPNFLYFRPSPLFPQETAFSCPVWPKGPSHMTFSLTAIQIPPSHLPRRVEPCWRSMMAFRPVTTTCRSSPITPPTRHQHGSRSTMRLSPSTLHHPSAFLDDRSPLYSCALRGNSDTNYTRSSTTFSTLVIDDTSLPFTGQWSFQNNSSLSSLDNTYHTTTNAGDFVNFNFSGAFALGHVCLPPSDRSSAITRHRCVRLWVPWCNFGEVF